MGQKHDLPKFNYEALLKQVPLSPAYPIWQDVSYPLHGTTPNSVSE